MLYNLSEVGFLNLSIPTQAPSRVLIDGEALPFQGGWANVTLPAGTHSLDLENFTNASEGFSIEAGATTFVDLSGAGELSINESGLVAGTSWGLSVDGTAFATSETALTLNLANGTYPVAYHRSRGTSCPARALRS